MRALVVASDPVGPAMAGGAIRSVELAHALATMMDVVLAAPGGEDVLTYDLHHPAALRLELATADVVVTQPAWPLLAGWLRGSSARVIYDLYDPEPLEALEFLSGRTPALRKLVTAMSLDRLRNALHDGHAFICASRAQRDLYTGALLAEGLLAPAVYDADPTLETLIGLVPFGVQDDPPRPGPGPRARFDLAPDDEVVLWNGGLWEWLDPKAAIDAVARLLPSRPNLKLVFMGASSAPQGRAAAERARAYAKDLGDAVFFNDGWVPYADRGGWLLDANCAISTHVDHLETRFAFRTRLLDCFWARLPVVCSSGDELGELVARDGLGAAVAPGDADALAAALAAVLDRGRAAYAPALAAAADQLRWARTTEPLLTLAAATADTRALGVRAGRKRPTGPGPRVRDAGYRTAKRALAAAGRPDWPRLG